METVEREQLKNMNEKLEDHVMEDSDNFKEIRTTLTAIRDNHLFHIEKDITVIKTNQIWTGRFFWLFVTASISGIIGYLFTKL